MIDCPSEDQLVRLLSLGAHQPSLSDVAGHIETCKHCKEVLDILSRADPAKTTAPLACDPPSPNGERKSEPENQPGHDRDVGTDLQESMDGQGRNNQSESRPRTVESTAFAASGAVADGRDRANEKDARATTEDQPPDPFRTVYETGVSVASSEPSSDAPQAKLPEFPGYEVLERLGQGGMGVVYKARQIGLNRLVALKTIRNDGEIRSDLLSRFLVEAEAVARVQHPNILHVYDIGSAGDVPFLSLELLEGGSLADRLGGTPQPARPAAELIATLARTVHVAHQAGIIHRDLKPSNVLFTGDGVPKIADFGLAKRLDSDSQQTASGQIMGSPSYMAPEQARGLGRGVGPAADVYALGAILYEMLTGRPPFKGDSWVETVRQVREDDPVAPVRLVPRIARDLETICLKCLAKAPHKRYATALALAEDLGRYLAGEPIHARPTPLWERGVKWARRRPVAATLLAVAAAATVGSLAAFLQYQRLLRERDRREQARVFKLQSQAADAIIRAQDALAQNDLSGAELILAPLSEKIGTDPRLRDLKARSDAVEAQIIERLALKQSREADRARYNKFLNLRNEALFRDTGFTGLDLPANPDATRRTADAALAIFRASESPDSQAVLAVPRSLSPREQDEITEGCYELLLVLAQAEPTPQAGLRRLAQAALLRPATRAYHMRRADCLSRAGDRAGSLAERHLADQVVASTAFDHCLMGQERYKHADPVAAIRHFQAAIQLEPGHFWAQCLSAICWLQLSRPTEARATLNSCLKVEPEFSWLLILRGYASSLLASSAPQAAAELELDFADRDFRKAGELLDQRPNDQLRYALFVNRGLLRRKRGDLDGAAADMRAAIQLSGSHYEAYAQLAQIYQIQGKADETVEQLDRAIKLRDDIAALYRQRADVQLHRQSPTSKQRAAALRDLEAAIGLEKPGSLVVAQDHTHRAQLLNLENRQSDALAACDLALAINPLLDEAHRLRIRLLLKLNRQQDAVASCDRLLASGKASAALYELRALARIDLKNYPRAIEDYTQALALGPDRAPLYHRKRGWLYLLVDAPQLALDDFEQAIKLNPSESDSYIGKGSALVRLGKHSDAVANAEKALSLGQPLPALYYTSARIYAQASIVASNEVRKRGKDAVVAMVRYQDRATALVSEAFRLTPVEKRASFWRDTVQADEALRTIRHRLRSVELALPAVTDAVSGNQRSSFLP
jgi:serine/threonine protein kinase/Tfp pilus assembly protein PilF